MITASSKSRTEAHTVWEIYVPTVGLLILQVPFRMGTRREVQYDDARLKKAASRFRYTLF